MNRRDCRTSEVPLCAARSRQVGGKRIRDIGANRRLWRAGGELVAAAGVTHDYISKCCQLSTEPPAVVGRRGGDIRDRPHTGATSPGGRRFSGERYI